jgi:sugar phosphate isomerase/epimerase
MRFAFSSNGFRKHSLIECIERCAEIGYDGVEILCDTPHAFPPVLTADDTNAIRSALERTGLRISNMNSFMLFALGDTYHPSWIQFDKAERDKRIEHTRNCLRLAAALGACTVSTEPGGPLDFETLSWLWLRRRKRIPESEAGACLPELERIFETAASPGPATLSNLRKSQFFAPIIDEGLSVFQAGIEEVLPEAEQCGVKLLIEPEPGLLVETSQQLESFLAKLDSPWVGANIDIGHLFCVGESPAFTLRKMAGRIDHLHLEDIAPDRRHFHLPPGKGAIDFESVFTVLQEIGYPGWVTVELYTFEDQIIDVARDALAFLKKALGRVTGR